MDPAIVGIIGIYWIFWGGISSELFFNLSKFIQPLSPETSIVLGAIFGFFATLVAMRRIRLPGRTSAHKGVLRLIGSGRVFDSATQASVIEIGNQSLRNIVYSDYIETYLESSLNKEITLFLIRNAIVAIQLPDGRVVKEEIIWKNISLSPPLLPRIVWLFLGLFTYGAGWLLYATWYINTKIQYGRLSKAFQSSGISMPA